MSVAGIVTWCLNGTNIDCPIWYNPGDGGYIAHWLSVTSLYLLHKLCINYSVNHNIVIEEFYKAKKFTSPKKYSSQIKPRNTTSQEKFLWPG